MSYDGTSTHHGGLIGGVGLALTLAGCTYLAAAGPGAEAQAWWPMPTRHLETPATVNPEADAEPISRGAMEADAAAPASVPDVIPSPPVVKPEREETVVAAPAVDAPVYTPVQAETLSPIKATFIVKFKPDPAIDDVIAGWRNDREAAIAGFAGWAEDDPVFGEMTLEGCSYSGELLLSRSLEAPVNGARGAVSALTTDIRGHSAVAYADPDFTAHPGMSAEDE